jgi:hypothetical protein
VNALRLAVMWVPALSAAVVVLVNVGPLPALALAAICVLGHRHWIAAAGVVAAAYFGDVPVLPLLPAALYRVVYADPIGSLIPKRTGSTRRARSLRHRCTPVVLCRHGAWQGFRLGDRAMWRGDPSTALDAYLRALADHPGEGLCARILELRAAEAAQAVGAARLAAALGSAAVADLPESPIFRQAVVAARGHAVRALAACDLGDPDEGRRLLRLGQVVAHRNRAAERYVRLGAVAVILSGQDALTEEQSQEIVAGALVGQSMRVLTPYELAWAALRWADVLAGRGRRDLAAIMYGRTIAMIEGDDLGITLDGLVARPEELAGARHAAKVLVEAVCGLLETSRTVDEALAARGAAALDVAARTGDGLVAARVCAARYARYGQVEARDAGDRCFDGSPAFFGDERLQGVWARVRADLTRPAPGTPVSVAEPAPWSWHPDVVVALRQRVEATVALFEGVARRVPAVGPVAAHARATAAALAAGPAVTRLIVPLEALIVEPVPDRSGVADASGDSGVGPAPGAADAGSAQSAEARAEATSVSVDAGGARANAVPATVDAVEVSVEADMAEVPVVGAAEPDRTRVVPRPRVDTGARRTARRGLRPAAPRPPEWLESAAHLTGAHCETVHGAWLLGHATGRLFVGVEQLVLAAAEDRECGAALAAAGVTTERLREAVERVLGAGSSEPRGLTAGAREVLTGALDIARRSGTVLVRPWHVLLAALAGPPSVVTRVLAAEGVCVDEVAVRLACGAANSLREPEPVALGPATTAFGMPARAVFEEAMRLAAPRERLTGDDVLAAVSGYALAPPSLRREVFAPSWGPLEHRRSARLDSALRELAVVSARWSRGVDLADLVVAAEGRPPWGSAHVPSAATTAVQIGTASSREIG